MRDSCGRSSGVLPQSASNVPENPIAVMESAIETAVSDVRRWQTRSVRHCSTEVHFPGTNESMVVALSR